ncbi:hypothetical protein SAMN04488688_10692 [Paenibacillus sp. cl141a]|uniref:hypothetical protein n=1 Tax=Paenibacillus sp. cl141a TaxID=1761877 RepID=UPI0008CD64BF|nr:hypothetical protein [Paenibacillus sp. cl141a]SEL83058.1 hypothetical protein SAMN04488688_10692 [Paenibacillus sp. cl141a]
MNAKDHELKLLTERYVRGEGSLEERTSYEELMLTDDGVLEIYMQVLSELDPELPGMADPEAFAEQVVEHEQIKPYTPKAPLRIQERPKRWYERAIVHYAIAASITMLFLFTGAFDRLLPSEISGQVPLSDTPSYSEQWVEKTTGWLDRLLSR